MSEQTGTTSKKDVSKFARSFLNPLPETIEIQAMKDFVAKEHFVVDVSEKAKVKISNIGGDFLRYFCPKIEMNNIAAKELVVNKITKNVFSSFLINVLGGENNVEITLSEFFAVFAKQPNGEDGPLLTDGYTNLAYARDIDGTIWAVHGFWYDDGWQFGATLCSCNPRMWVSDDQVLSRKLPCQVFDFN